MLQGPSLEARGERTPEEAEEEARWWWCWWWWWKTEGHPGEPLLLERESPMSCGTVCSGLLIASRLLCDRLWCRICEAAMSWGPTDRFSLLVGMGSVSPWSMSMSNFRFTGNWLGLRVMGL